MSSDDMYQDLILTISTALSGHKGKLEVIQQGEEQDSFSSIACYVYKMSF